MDFIAKKNAHDRLLGVTHLEADRELLKQKAPQHDLLKRGIFNRLQDASSILFALLDFATEEEIVRYRRTLAAVKERAASEAARLKAEEEEAAQLQAAEEETAQLKAEEEEAPQLKAEEEARLKATEEEVACLKEKENANTPEAAAMSAPAEKKSSSKSKSTQKSSGDA